MLSSKLSENVARFLAAFDHQEWTVICTLMVINFINTITFNNMEAFYPKEAHNRGISTGDIGIIIGTYQISRFLMAPFAGKYITKIGPQFAFFIGLFITAATAFGFGLLTVMPNSSAFFWASLGIRVFQALARTFIVISSLTITAKLFPEHISLLGGLLESFAGVGYILGPVIGSALFELGGFILPNFTMGTLMALTSVIFVICSTSLINRHDGGPKKPVEADYRRPSDISMHSGKKNKLKLQHCSTGDLENPYLKSSVGHAADSGIHLQHKNCSKISSIAVDCQQKPINVKSKTNDIGFMSVLKHADTWLIMSVITLRGITCSFYQAPLPEHLASLNRSALLVGALYTVMSISYFVSAPLWGLLIEWLKVRWQKRPTTMITLSGSILAMFSTLLMGPFPPMSNLFAKSILLVSISFALLGFSAAALYIPVFQQCAEISKKESTGGENDDDSTQVYACLFGFVQSSSTLGSFAGNLIGGYGAQQIGFAWTCTIISFAHLLFVSFFSLYTLFSL